MDRRSNSALSISAFTNTSPPLVLDSSICGEAGAAGWCWAMPLLLGHATSLEVDTHWRHRWTHACSGQQSAACMCGPARQATQQVQHVRSQSTHACCYAKLGAPLGSGRGT